MPLIAIVSGMEHSGTTWLADLIRCHPKINGGFECGVLLGNSPADFPKIQPFYQWMLKARHPTHWAVSPEAMRRIVSAPDWQTMYSRIIAASPLFNENVPWLLDKTPRYLPHLKTIMHKVDVPVVVIYKPILYQYTSYKKRNFTIEGFTAHYTAYIGGLFEAYKHFRERIMIVIHEDLVRQPQTVLPRIFRHLKTDMPAPDRFNIPASHGAGPVYADYDLNKAQADLSLITGQEKRLLQRLSQDDIIFKLAR